VSLATAPKARREGVLQRRKGRRAGTNDLQAEKRAKETWEMREARRYDQRVAMGPISDSGEGRRAGACFFPIETKGCFVRVV